MRTKSTRRFANGRGPFVYSTNMELCGVTAQFQGGFVQVNGVAQEVNPGASNWASVQVFVDGVAQGPSRLIWQASGQSNVQVGLNHTVLVSPGRHRISLIFSSSTAPGSWGGNGGYIEALEV